ncbi:phosphotransferase family protein [Arthrobacter sp. TMN-37]
MRPQWSPRIGWNDLPEQVRAGVENVLGEPVAHFAGQQGGFSPGSADRVVTLTGRRAFVKAVGPALNATSPGIHRREAAVTAVLPEGLPAASLIGTFDDGEWIALVLSDVDGRHPHLPWQRGEVHLVLDALLQLAQAPVPPAAGQLPELVSDLAGDFAGWARIRVDPPEDAGNWVRDNLDGLERLAAHGVQSLRGGCLVHTDLRADNILITPTNAAVLVDWPWACIGAGWFDALSVLINTRVFDPSFDVEDLLRTHPVFAGVAPEDIDGVLSGFAGYFLDAARQPPPPGLPTLRTFQRQQGDAVLAWLRQRLAGRS